jgi:hypothetical protein
MTVLEVNRIEQKQLVEPQLRYFQQRKLRAGE